MNKPVSCAIIQASHIRVSDDMSETINLADEIKKHLPGELIDFMRLAGEAASGRGERIYLVGGVVRDLLLEQPNLDLDLVVAGDAIELAEEIAHTKPAKIKTHPRFNTAKLSWDSWSVDLTTARLESYAKPGALPTITPSTIENDLARRDFTINAMAVHLEPGRYGELIDLHGGVDDLIHRLVRILHDNSFIDDATRIWRGLRYEQRLGFKLEENTLKLLKRDVSMLETISGDRLRYEVECVLKEKQPENIIIRADELGALAEIHPALKGDGWLKENFEQARQLTAPDPPPMELYLAILAYPLSAKECEGLVTRLRLPREAAKALRDSLSIRPHLKELDDPQLKPSAVHSILYKYSTAAVAANLLASSLPIARRHIKLFLDKLVYVKPILGGEDLKRMGVTYGPHIKEPTPPA